MHKPLLEFGEVEQNPEKHAQIQLRRNRMTDSRRHFTNSEKEAVL